MPSVGEGARPKAKDKQFRNLPPIDHKAMHKGSGQEITAGVRQVEASTSLSPKRQDPGGILAAATRDLDQQSAQIGYVDLDREIEKLESFIEKEKSQLKESSVCKKKKQQTERIAKLRKELWLNNS